jgi:hypothetical protein
VPCHADVLLEIVNATVRAMDYEVEITAYPAKYPVGLSEDECAALESTKAGARWAVEFEVFKANELEPGESPL